MNEQLNNQNAPAEVKQKRMFSAIQPSGNLTLGNYLGAIKNWKILQDEYDSIFSVADLHALTVRQNPAELRKNTLGMAASLIACGIDAKKHPVFIQSHVAEHAELSWILSCYTMFGELSRMTQFKDKSQKNADNINAGLFTYPSLMAADILLYNTEVVPVGEDQRQHVELARDIAVRFNSVYGDVFNVPESFIPTYGARVKSLAEPTKKMSKSDANQNAYVLILDDKDTVMRKFKRAVTDSDAEIVYKEGKDGINNLLTIMSAFTGRSISELEAEFQGKGYGDFKMAVGETVADSLAPIRERYDELMKDKAYLEECIKEGAERASYIACRVLSKVYKKVGLLPRIR